MTKMGKHVTADLDSLVSPKSRLPVYLMNNMTNSANPKKAARIVVVNADTRNPQTFIIPPVEVPIRVDTLHDRKALRESVDLRQWVNEGLLLVLDPAYAETLLSNPKTQARIAALKEQDRDRVVVRSEDSEPAQEQGNAILIHEIQSGLKSGILTAKAAIRKLILADLTDDDLTVIATMPNAEVAAWARELRANEGAYGDELAEPSEPTPTAKKNTNRRNAAKALAAK